MHRPAGERFKRDAARSLLKLRLNEGRRDALLVARQSEEERVAVDLPARSDVVLVHEFAGAFQERFGRRAWKRELSAGPSHIGLALAFAIGGNDGIRMMCARVLDAECE